MRLIPLTRHPLLFLAACVGTLFAGAQELQVNAQIVSVDPIYPQGEMLCDVAPPERSAGLGAMLAWDLRDRCRRRPHNSRASSYRVVYEWDGRRFSTTTAVAPTGTSLPVLLTID